MTIAWRPLGRRLQLLGLSVLVFLLPISKAAIELTFGLLLLGWIAEYGLGGAWSSSVWRRGGGVRLVAVALLIYLAWCAFTIPFSTHVDLSIKGFVRKTLQYALFFLIAADAVRHIRPSRLALLILSSAAVVAVDAILQEFLKFDPLLHHGTTIYNRMTGPYENPGDLAVYLMVTLLVALALLAHPAVRGARRGMLWALIVVEALCLVRTECQSAWLGTAIGMGIMAWRCRALRVPLLRVGGFGVLAAVAWLAAHHRLVPALTFTDVGARDRLVIWQAGWHMVQTRPLIGLGLNTFMANYLQYWVGGERQPRYAHNGYLQTAAEVGVIGLACLLVFFWFLFRRLWQGMQRAHPDVQPLLLGLTTAVLVFAMQAAVDTSFYAMRQVTLFWVWAGLAFGFAEGHEAA